MKLAILFKIIIIHSFGQFFDHHERFHHFIYIFRQMRRISDDFQSHNRCKPNCRTLFGTTLKTPRMHFSKMSQSDCVFDIYATIVDQYRMKFSTDVVGAKRYLPRVAFLSLFQHNCVSLTPSNFNSVCTQLTASCKIKRVRVALTLQIRVLSAFLLLDTICCQQKRQ